MGLTLIVRDALHLCCSISTTYEPYCRMRTSEHPCKINNIFVSSTYAHAYAHTRSRSVTNTVTRQQGRRTPTADIVQAWQPVDWLGTGMQAGLTPGADGQPLG